MWIQTFGLCFSPLSLNQLSKVMYGFISLNTHCLCVLYVTASFPTTHKRFPFNPVNICMLFPGRRMADLVTALSSRALFVKPNGTCITCRMLDADKNNYDGDKLAKRAMNRWKEDLVINDSVYFRPSKEMSDWDLRLAALNSWECLHRKWDSDFHFLSPLCHM